MWNNLIKKIENYWFVIRKEAFSEDDFSLNFENEVSLIKLKILHLIIVEFILILSKKASVFYFYFISEGKITALFILNKI